MIILGVDPGLQNAGYSVASIISGKTSLIECGVLKLKPKDPLPKRVKEFHDFVKSLFTKYKIDHIALETPFIGRNAQTFLKLGYLRGILYLISEQENVTIFEFAPRQVKQAVTGNGGADKDQVQMMVKRLFPQVKDFKTNDVSDAVAVCLCGLWQSSNRLSYLK